MDKAARKELVSSILWISGFVLFCLGASQCGPPSPWHTIEIGNPAVSVKVLGEPEPLDLSSKDSKLVEHSGFYAEYSDRDDHYYTVFDFQQMPEGDSFDALASVNAFSHSHSSSEGSKLLSYSVSAKPKGRFTFNFSYEAKTEVGKIGYCKGIVLTKDSRQWIIAVIHYNMFSDDYVDQTLDSMRFKD